MPGPWAPSTSVSTPRSASSATRRAIGRTRPVGLVTWSRSARRVRGVTPAAIASFLAIDPRLALDGYRCDLSAADLRCLGATADEPLLWLALVMVEESGALTVNLRAPIVINPRTMTGHQVLPHNCLYPLRHVLVDAG
jgi:flagellar assembly factor FliW